MGFWRFPGATSLELVQEMSISLLSLQTKKKASFFNCEGKEEEQRHRSRKEEEIIPPPDRKVGPTERPTPVHDWPTY